MKQILIYIYLLSISSSFAQVKTLFIRDKFTNEPISLVAVYTQKGNGTYSQEDGSLQFTLQTNDTLWVSHVSYQKIILTFNEIKRLENSTIYLIPISTELNEVIVRPSKLIKKRLGYFDEKTDFKRAGPGGNKKFDIFVNHIKNISGASGFINKLYFDLHVDIFERSNSKVRIRVFSVGSDGLPKDDILNKEIIKVVDRFSPNIKVDISDLNIAFPPEGVFIGLEFFCSFELKNFQSHSKTITDCPHIETAKVSNFEEIGNSYALDIVKNRIQWVCWSNGNYWSGLKGHVFKFGAEVSQ